MPWIDVGHIVERIVVDTQQKLECKIRDGAWTEIPLAHHACGNDGRLARMATGESDKINTDFERYNDRMVREKNFHICIYVYICVCVCVSVTLLQTRKSVK